MADITLSLPSEVRWSPNHAGPRSKTRGVFLHSTRGGTRGPGGSMPTSGDAWIDVLEREYQATLNYVDGPNASQVGPTWVVGPHKAARCISDDNVCWCQTVDNDDFLSIEVAQPAYLPPYSDFQYQACAEICARYARKYGFPIIHLPRQTAPDVEQNGLIGHEDSYAGYSRGKTDPGYRWDWGRFIALTAQTYQQLFVPQGDPAYSMAGDGIRNFLLKNTEYGKPRIVFYHEGDEICYCTATAQHPLGVVVMWRKYLFEAGKNPIGIAYA